MSRRRREPRLRPPSLPNQIQQTPPPLRSPTSAIVRISPRSSRSRRRPRSNPGRLRLFLRLRDHLELLDDPSTHAELRRPEHPALPRQASSDRHHPPLPVPPAAPPPRPLPTQSPTRPSLQPQTTSSPRTHRSSAAIPEQARFRRHRPSTPTASPTGPSTPCCLPPPPISSPPPDPEHHNLSAPTLPRPPPLVLLFSPRLHPPLSLAHRLRQAPRRAAATGHPTLRPQLRPISHLRRAKTRQPPPPFVLPTSSPASSPSHDSDSSLPNSTSNTSDLPDNHAIAQVPDSPLQHPDGSSSAPTVPPAPRQPRPAPRQFRQCPDSPDEHSAVPRQSDSNPNSN